jgi:hypothetical protein
MRHWTIEVVLPLSPEAFARHCLFQPSFQSDFQTARGDKDVNIGPWVPSQKPKFCPKNVGAGMVLSYRPPNFTVNDRRVPTADEI